MISLPNGLKVNYVESGPANAPVLLLTHGFLGSWRDWRYSVGALAEQSSTPLRVIALDWPGFGDSDKAIPDYSLNFFCDFLRDFADYLGLREFDLAGHSMGGKYSLAFATLYPDYVRRLVLVAADGCTSDPWWVNFAGLGWFQRLSGAGLRLLGSPHLLRTMFRRVFYSPRYYPLDPEINRLANQLRQPEQVEVLQQLTLNFASLSLLRAEGMQPLLNQLQTPTLLIWGKQDAMVPVLRGYELRRLLPNARLFLFDQCGHMPQVEKAAAVNRLILEFCQAQTWQDRLEAASA